MSDSADCFIATVARTDGLVLADKAGCRYESRHQSACSAQTADYSLVIDALGPTNSRPNRLGRLSGHCGLAIFGEGKWAAAKHGGKGIRGWKKLHFGVDGDGVIVGLRVLMTATLACTSSIACQARSVESSATVPTTAARCTTLQSVAA
ncbi:MAG: hypothetical protein ACJAUC_004013 [Planctomycetota bacterium]|jgi:hypothetical protein